MATVAKKKSVKPIWIIGNKARGLSLYKLNYKKPQWRLAFWYKNKLYKTEEYPTRTEALREGRAWIPIIRKSAKTGGFIYG